MERNVVWTPWDGQGCEHLHLARRGKEILADGVISGVMNGLPFRLRYIIKCDLQWRVREIHLDPLDDGRPGIVIVADGEGHWKDISGVALAGLERCIDIDISATPFTNTLPIRRMTLNVGEPSEIVVAYVSVPELQVDPVVQRYTCLEASPQAGLYKYESLGSGFTTNLPVDGDGLVLDYPERFKRIWPT